MPAIPITLSLGKPLASRATWHIASNGLATTMIVHSGEFFASCSVTLDTISWFSLSKSSRLIPGWRGLPLVMTARSDPAVSS
jgi:hypothetical protein